MKNHAADTKTNHRSASPPSPDAPISSKGIALKPPKYGLEFVDHGSSVLPPVQGWRPPGTATVQRKEESPPKPNRTGLPDNLRSGIESLSGISMAKVQVHYNSSRPAKLAALAYAQGSDIHMASGQERHLPHEAWHVVQQARGQVRPTMQLPDGVPVNDDKGLELEADIMGAKAASLPGAATDSAHGPQVQPGNSAAAPGSASPIQAVGVLEWGSRLISAIPGRDIAEQAWGAGSRVAGLGRGLGSVVAGLGRGVGLNLPGTYQNTTIAALTPELQAGLVLAQANQNAAPPTPPWLVAGQVRPVVGVPYAPGVGVPSFTNPQRITYNTRWGRTFYNRDGLLPGVTGAGGYNEYYAQPTPGWTPLAGEAPWGQNRILRQTNDPTGTYWWATNNHYNTFSYIRDA